MTSRTIARVQRTVLVTALETAVWSLSPLGCSRQHHTADSASDVDSGPTDFSTPGDGSRDPAPHDSQITRRDGSEKDGADGADPRPRDGAAEGRPESDAGSIADSGCSMENVAYPPRSGAINVKTAYGAKGDGVTDDTAAILQAIRDNITTPSQTPAPASFSQMEHILYFPDGVYIVSNQLVWQDAGSHWGNNLSFQGQSETGTIFRLKDKSPGFADPKNPRAVIYTASASGLPNGTGEEAYEDNLKSFTVDTGHGNPGAVGIDWLANNQGILGHVTIQSPDRQGVVGLSLTRDNGGPCLVRNLTVKGFDLGISVHHANHIAMKRIVLIDQNVAGMKNDGNVVSVEDLHSSNAVPAVLNFHDYCLLTLIGATLTGGAGGSAILNGYNPANKFNAKLYARNVTASGYESAIREQVNLLGGQLDSGKIVPGNSQSEWVSDPVLSLFPGPTTSLQLPIREAPASCPADFADWANVQDYGAVPDGREDNSAAVQAAIDSGKRVVYFPLGTYRIGGTVHVRANIQKIIGFGGILVPSSSFPSGQPALRIESTTANTVTIERMHFRGNYDVNSDGERFPLALLDASSQTLVLEDLIGLNYANMSGAGPVFLEDVCCGPFNFDHQTVWARQLNSEPLRPSTASYTSDTHVTNDGGTLWVLGLKTEEASTIVQTTGGGSTEILGASIYQLRPYNGLPDNFVPASIPAFINTEGRHSLIYAVGTSADFEVNIRETRQGTTRNLYRSYSSSTPNAYREGVDPALTPEQQVS